MTRPRKPASPVGPGVTAAVRGRKPKPPATTEREVLVGCLQALALFGVEAGRRNTGAMLNSKGQLVRFGKPGDPDIDGLLPDGRKLAVECKRPGARPRPEQYDAMHRINESNGVAFWVNDPKQLADVLPKLIAGCRVEIDDDGIPYVTDEPKGAP